MRKQNCTKAGPVLFVSIGSTYDCLLLTYPWYAHYSPYKRTMETWEIMKETLEEKNDVTLVGTRQEPRIAEQQFGNFQVGIFFNYGGYKRYSSIYWD